MGVLLFTLLLALMLAGCDELISAGAAPPADEVEILAGGVHYDGDRGWVRFRYRVGALPAEAHVQFNNFAADTLRLESYADTVRVDWTHRYMQPPDPMREWHVVRLLSGGEVVARDTLRIDGRYGRP